jgi:RimJ/RimL family protein N-acetyltransferase
MYPFKMEIDISALRGKYVYLEQLHEKDRESIRPLAKDERIWQYNLLLLVNDSYDQQFDHYFSTALNAEAMGGQQAFVIKKIATGEIIGMTRYANIDTKEKRLEIGYTWYLPSVWGKVYNRECKLLLLQYAFEVLKFNRVQLNVAGQNIRSQKAVEKIGGVKEGVLRKHGYRNDGSRRDTVIFSIIDDEWPQKKELLKQLIANSEKT